MRIRREFIWRQCMIRTTRCDHRLELPAAFEKSGGCVDHVHPTARTRHDGLRRKFGQSAVVEHESMWARMVGGGGGAVHPGIAKCEGDVCSTSLRISV